MGELSSVISSILLAIVDNNGGGGGPGQGVPTDPVLRNVSVTRGSNASLPLKEDGDFLIAFISGSELSDPGWSSAPSGWNIVQADDGESSNSAIFWRISDGSEGLVTDFNPGQGLQSSFVSIVCSIRGVDTVTPFSQTPEVSVLQGLVNSTTADLADITVAENGEFVLAFVVGSESNNHSYTPPAGFTEIADRESTGNFSSGVVASAAVIASATAGTLSGLSFTCSSSISHRTMGVVLKRGLTIPQPPGRDFSMDETLPTPDNPDNVNFSMDENL